jgi:type I restriction enzyme, S subunit
MSKYPLVPLTEMADIFDHLREPVSQTVRNKRIGTYPYYGATGQIGTIDDYRQDGKYVLLGEDGAPFLDPLKPKAYLVEGKCWVNNHAHVLKGKEGICDDDFLCIALNFADYSNAVTGSTRLKLPQNMMENLFIPKPSFGDQKIIASIFKRQSAEIEKAKTALGALSIEVSNLANAIIYDSLKSGINENYSLSDVIDEVKNGIGKDWKAYPVYGATRQGLALAKEPPGKHPQRYKPITPGTVFYNPMRILIGSIAFAEDDVQDGITSPDYVVLKGKEGLVNSRWFYYWLRSPLGVQCINSLARGAVRERMLFNRLAEGNINLPDFAVQEKASEALKNLKAVRTNLNKQHKDIHAMPNKLLANIFQEV